MKEKYNHGCYYRVEDYLPFKDDSSYIIHDVVLYNDSNEVLAVFITVIEDSSDTYETIRPTIDNNIELAENLIQMSDKEICEWVITNGMSRFHGYTWYYIPDHPDFYYDVRIGDYGLFRSE